MSWVLVFVLALVALIFYVTFVVFPGGNLARFDKPEGKLVGHDSGPDEALDAVFASLRNFNQEISGLSGKARLMALRNYLETLSEGIDFSCQFIPANADGVSAEWVVAPGANPNKRLLYIHGGAYMMGSPRSHRTITSRYAEITGGVVLAIDYRLVPEYNRRAGIEDCQTAYRWLLDNGPEGAAPAQRIWVSGDSAGGNLTLTLLARVRDQGLRTPDAAVALCPHTDSTGSSPSIKQNLRTDPLVGPLFTNVVRVPLPVVHWFSFLWQRINPSSPLISPVFGDLSNLPPTLIQASRTETLRDDARRYTNKAIAAGSPVVLQEWERMIHVWHIFHPELPAAKQAWEEIDKFLKAYN
ncbi:MAG: alpha/beta hydrolase [Proteobacteria bacterium]|nr:MAG: alpha/beta hydrolase [Pseudomonadota bacterium]